MEATPNLYLASASPRRMELLRQLALYPTQWPADVPEERAAGETPVAYSQRVALAKAQAIGSRLSADPAACVIAADTEVVDGDQVLGKPGDRADAERMLRGLSGRRHQALSSVVVLRSGAHWLRSVITEVEFAPIPTSLLQRYLDSGEWSGKAGAYAIQGLAAAFVRRIDGSYSNVMGLPLFETHELLHESGFLAI